MRSGTLVSVPRSPVEDASRSRGEARWVSPALTTVRQPAREKGCVAAELLIGLLAGTAEPCHVNLETQLVERESVALVRS
jgi:DNA-binding LacI/PurR family transcriptional regulator